MGMIDGRGRLVDDQDDELFDVTCPECGLSWLATKKEPEFPLCSKSCLSHFLDTTRLVYNQSFRWEIENWAEMHGYTLLESEIDDLCSRLQPLVNIVRNSTLPSTSRA